MPPDPKPEDDEITNEVVDQADAEGEDEYVPDDVEGLDEEDEE